MPWAARAERAARTQELPEELAREIAVEAYVYALPLVLMEMTRRVATNVARPDATGRAPVNRFGHQGKFPDSRSSDVLRPDRDMLRSMLWFDVSQQPLVVRIPDSGGRYHFLSLLDMWTDAFASPGTRTTGNASQAFAITGPYWMGPPLRGVAEIRSPTAQGWIVGHTQANSEADYAAVEKFHANFSAVPLAQYGKTFAPEDVEPDTALDMSPPLSQVERMQASAFFSLFTKSVRLNPSHANDFSVVARMRRLGLEPGRAFDIGATGPVAQSALEEAPSIALERLREDSASALSRINGWEIPLAPIGTYGTNYLRRASTALRKLGTNVPEDKLTFSLSVGRDGRALDSAKIYVLHFDKAQLPPVHAFWSLALYDAAGHFSDNPLQRHAIGSRDNLTFNADGSLDIFIQRETPRLESNWLVSPQQGAFSLAIGLYWPKPQAVDGLWRPPILIPAD